MLMIRFMRIGRRNQPSFKIVVTEKTKSSTGGRFVQEVGFYNPVTKEKVIQTERIRYWISQGAKPTPTVSNLLISEKVTEGVKTPKHKKLKKPVEATQEVEPHSAEGGSTSAQMTEQTPNQSSQSSDGTGQKSDFNQNTAEPTPESPKTPESPPQAPLSPPSVGA